MGAECGPNSSYAASRRDRRVVSRDPGILYDEPPVLVATVPNDREQIAALAGHHLDPLAFFFAQIDVEYAGVVLNMLSDPEPRTNNHARDSRTIEHKADSYIGDAGVVLGGHDIQRR